jgi:hypothetical protein
MAEQNGVQIGPDGMLLTAKGHIASEYVNSFRMRPMDFAEISVIGLRLYESNAADPATGLDTPTTLGVQVRMTAQTAEKLAHQLLALSADLRGDGHPLQ